MIPGLIIAGRCGRSDSKGGCRHESRRSQRKGADITKGKREKALISPTRRKKKREGDGRKEEEIKEVIKEEIKERKKETKEEDKKREK
jgi:hypothetical protein